MENNKGQSFADKYNTSVEDSKIRKKYKLKSDKYLVSNINNISFGDAKNLISYAEKKLDTSQYALLVLLSLFLGRPIKTIVDDSNKFKRDEGKFQGAYVFVDQPQIVKVEKKSEDRDIKEKSKSNGNVLLPLPLFLTNSISAFLSNSEFSLKDEEVKELLKKINIKFHSRITAKRISRYMPQWLLTSGVDSAVVCLLCGKSSDFTTAIHYFNCPVKTLLIHYEKYLNHLMGTGHVVLEKNTELIVGTGLSPEPNQITDLFQEIKKSITSENDVVIRHNYFVFYNITLLSLATAHRPVKDPFGFKDAFCLNSNRVYINDKDVSPELRHRIIPLNEKSTTQLKYYLDYLERYEHKLSLFSTEIRNAFTGIKNNTNPLFFFISEKMPVSVTPKGLLKYLLKFSKHISVDNWQRHYLRTYLSEVSVHGDLIDAWMNHLSVGASFFNTYSSRAVSDLRIVADQIDKMMLDLNINPVSISS